jgi:hypothetical protein
MQPEADTLGGMFGVALSPEFVPARPRGLVMFQGAAPATAELAGLLVGARRGAFEDWQPASDVVSVDAVIVHGVHVQLARTRQTLLDGKLGWPLTGRVRIGSTLAVYLRNDERELRELRAVLVLRSDERAWSRRRASTRWR